MLWYVPLEPVQGRYTEQWSRATTGWMEREFLLSKIAYVRISGGDETPSEMNPQTIGSVYDTSRRVNWCFTQIQNMIARIQQGEKPTHIHFDDMWHPGLEALIQFLSEKKLLPKIVLSAFCHAQSPDKWDFMRRLSALKPWEFSMASSFNVLFVNSTLLKDLLENAFDGTTVKVCGHVFNSEEVLELADLTDKGIAPLNRRRPRFLFCSRLEEEKDPLRFVRAARAVKLEYPSYSFAILSGMNGIVSSSSEIRSQIEKAEKEGIIEVRTGLTKQEYYTELTQSMFHVSCSLQDWTSFCLLEALTLGCYPIYPNYRSFPEAFRGFSRDLYPFWESMTDIQSSEFLADSMKQAIAMCNRLSVTVNHMRRCIVGHHDRTVTRMMNTLEDLKPWQ